MRVDLIDLHRDGFDPVMHEQDLAAWRMKSIVDDQAARYQERLKEAEHLVFVFPIWWESMPAGTKGFLDKVMTKGIVYSEPKPGRPFVNGPPGLRGVTLMSVLATPDFGRAIRRVLTCRVPGNRLLTAVYGCAGKNNCAPGAVIGAQGLGEDSTKDVARLPSALGASMNGSRLPIWGATTRSRWSFEPEIR
jgi:hypothetical protein